MDNPEEPATHDTQYEYICVGHHSTHTNANNVNKT